MSTFDFLWLFLRVDRSEFGLVSNRPLSTEPHHVFGHIHFKVAEQLLGWAGPMGLDAATVQKIHQVITSSNAMTRADKASWMGVLGMWFGATMDLHMSSSFLFKLATVLIQIPYTKLRGQMLKVGSFCLFYVISFPCSHMSLHLFAEALAGQKYSICYLAATRHDID